MFSIFYDSILPYPILARTHVTKQVAYPCDSGMMALSKVIIDNRKVGVPICFWRCVGQHLHDRRISRTLSRAGLAARRCWLCRRCLLATACVRAREGLVTYILIRAHWQRACARAVLRV